MGWVGGLMEGGEVEGRETSAHVSTAKRGHGHRNSIAWLVCLVSVITTGSLACDKSDDGQGASAASPSEPARSQGLQGDAQDWYDEEGMLRASDEVVSGLPLPMGIALFRVEPRRYIYHAEVPLPKVLAYFGRRLITGEVERIGEGAVYRRAMPKRMGDRGRGESSGGLGPGIAALEVSVLPSSKTGTRIEIRQLPSAPVERIDPGDARKKMQDAARRWD